MKYNSYISFLKPYLKKQSKYLILICMLSIITSAASLYIPYTYKVLIDQALPNLNKNLTIRVVVIIFFAGLIYSGANTIKDYLLAQYEEGIAFDIRMNINKKINKLNYNYFDHNTLSDVLSRYSREVDIIKESCGSMILSTVSNIVTLLAAMVLIAILNFKIFIISIFLLTIYLLNNRYWGKKVKKIAEKSMIHNEAAIGDITENFNNISVTKMYNLYDYVNNKFKTSYQKLFGTNIKLELNYSININSGSVIIYIMIAMAWFIGGMDVINGTMSIGELLTLINYQNMLIGPANFFCRFNNSFQNTTAAIDRLNQFLEYNEEIGGEIILTEKIDQITFKDVTFQYDKEKEILLNSNMVIYRGEITGIVGPSGSGKSSIIKILTQLYPIKKGSVYLNNVNLSDIKLESLRSTIAVIPQDSLFFNQSIYENLKACTNFKENELEEWSRKIDIYDEIMNFSDQWDTILSEKTSNISGGQRKRLDIVRALLYNADIIILDESTAGLDAERRKRLFDILDSIKSNKIIICVSHNSSEFPYFDRIYQINNKQISKI